MKEEPDSRRREGQGGKGRQGKRRKYPGEEGEKR